MCSTLSSNTYVQTPTYQFRFTLGEGPGGLKCGVGSGGNSSPCTESDEFRLRSEMQTVFQNTISTLEILQNSNLTPG